MNEQAEFAPAVMEAEAELIVPAPETNNEVSESASRAAAMIALNETAAQKDWSQERVEAAQSDIESKFSQDSERTGGLVSALEEARTDSVNGERSHASALAALDQAARRAELLNIEDAAAHQDWDEARIQAAKDKVEAKYS